MKNKKTLSSFLLLLITIASAGQKEIKKLPFATSSPVKYTVELISLYTNKSWDGGDDYREELYGAISVCLSAAGYPPTVQLDYTYKNPPDKEINGGVEPLASLSTNTNGRILWRQSDSKNDRKIFLDSKTRDKVAGGYEKLRNGFFEIESKAVFLFDPKKDPYAAFRLFADMWESDPSDDDEHFTVGIRRLAIPVSEIPIGGSKSYTLQIFDSSSRHYASISIKAEPGQ